MNKDRIKDWIFIFISLVILILGMKYILNYFGIL
jgi:hypothetical protein